MNSKVVDISSENYREVGILLPSRRQVTLGRGSPPTLQCISAASLERAITSSGFRTKNGLTVGECW